LTVNLTHHHILSDAYSTDFLVNELLNLYLGLINNTINNNAIVKEQLNYFDYQAYQEYILQTAKYKTAISTLVTSLNNSTSLQLKHKIVARSNVGNFSNFLVEADVYNNLTQLALEGDVSLYSILLTALHYTLSIFNGDNHDFPIGITISNRPYEFKNAIGPFIGMLPIFFKYNKSESISTNIIMINQEILYLNEHRDLNLNIIARESKKNLEEIMGLIHVMFTMHNFNSSPGNRSLQDKVEVIDVIQDTEKFGISILAKEVDTGINFCISHASELYENSYIQSVFNSYVNLLKNLNHKTILTPFKPTMLLSKSDYQQIVYTWNNTNASYPNDKTIHELFEEQVIRTPDNIAVVYENKELTYKKLNEASNQLANYLRTTYQIKGDDLIALCLYRNEYMLIAILAVLKSGAGYVPMDPVYPDERISYILKDTKSKILLTNERYAINLGVAADISVLPLDSQKIQQALHLQATSNPIRQINSTNLAYVIYTSGTTGKPKGVMVEHGNLVNTILSLSSKYNIKPLEHFLLFSNYIFDASVEQIFLPLTNNSTLIIPNKSTIEDTDLFLDFIRVHGITHLEATPSYLQLLDPMILANLNRLISGGEYLPLDLYTKLAKQVDLLINVYGPTEASITSTIAINNLSIGKPLSNVMAYILDYNMQPVPIGAIGELYIGGMGLARGYLNLPELTSEKFISNPFQNKDDKLNNKNSRLYKTGDLARYLPDGNIEYIGRNDFQVKIRGFRIELGEIESKLVAYPGINQAVVLALDHKNSLENGNTSGNKYLAGYYASDTKLDETTILTELGNHLPDYMVPSVLVHLDSIPLTINGKLDRKALPDPEFISTATYVAPRNDLEASVCTIYAKILNMPQNSISIIESFFRLGGNSLSVIKLIAQLKHDLGINIDFSFIYKYPSIKKISENIHEMNHSHLLRIIGNLNASDNNKPIFILFHTARGSSEVYSNFLEYIRKDFNVILVNSHNLSQFITKNYIYDFNELCNLYFNALEPLITRDTKVFISGWSFGGLVAIGVLQKMLTFKNKLNSSNFNLVLFDSIPPDIIVKLVSETSMENEMDELYPSLPQKEVGAIHDKMYINYTLNSNIDDVKMSLIKASVTEESISRFNEYQDYKYYGFERYFKDVESLTMDATHETLFDEKFLSEMAKYIINLI
jgi:amino acid adenylation domain-containing protein